MIRTYEIIVEVTETSEAYVTRKLDGVTISVNRLTEEDISYISKIDAILDSRKKEGN